MIIFHSIKELQEDVERHKKNGKTFGFIPTMGALHEGHLSLIEQAKKHCDLTMASIFVNPKQFNNSSDLTNYPRTIDQDIEMLECVKCDILFIPHEKEIYPKQDEDIKFDFGLLSTTIEAKFRPGHFDGVARVVGRLFEIVNADKAFFGEKDFQQLAIVRKLCQEISSAPEIIACKTIREKSGLAMSSRNLLLTENERELASQIYMALNEADKLTKKMKPNQICDKMDQYFKKIKNIELEYFEIVDSKTFKVLKSWADSDEPVALIAAFIGGVRILDNLLLNTNQTTQNLNNKQETSQVKIA